MAITTLDSKTALIVVDLQKGICSYPTVTPANDVAKRASALIQAFRTHHLPIVLVNVTGRAPGRTEQTRAGSTQFSADFADFLPELNQQPHDHVVTKKAWGAFTNSDLDAHLKSLGITQVIILGIATSVGVESTARQAYEHGYNVTLAVDAMTDMSEEANQYAITKIFPKLGETGTTQEIIDLLNATHALS
jgi:nicotinamidase-related amidase